MKPVEEMNAMEVCAYLVAKASRKEIGEDEIRRLYDIHCAKLKKELAEKNVGKVSDEFRKELSRNSKRTFEPAPLPNCGCAKETFVVQRRIPTVEKSKDWQDISGELSSLELALDFVGVVDVDKWAHRVSDRPKRVFRIVRKRVEASVIFETEE